MFADSKGLNPDEVLIKDALAAVPQNRCRFTESREIEVLKGSAETCDPQEA